MKACYARHKEYNNNNSIILLIKLIIMENIIYGMLASESVLSVLYKFIYVYVYTYI